MYQLDQAKPVWILLAQHTERSIKFLGLLVRQPFCTDPTPAQAPHRILMRIPDV
jgi:hypothetical protein